jgi:predicted DNA-binding protein
MPTQGPRINLTIPPDLFELLGQLASLTGQPRSTIVRELLIEATPQFQAIVEALTLAKQKKIEALESLTPTLESLSRQTKNLAEEMRLKSRAARAHLKVVPKVQDAGDD